MTPDVLHSRLAAYLAMREALGFRMRAPTLLLTDFVQYVIAHNLPDPIRAQLAVDWACSGSATRGVGGHAARLSVVRGFLSFLRASAPETEVPDRHLLATARRPLPYLFSADELTRLLTALESPRPCRSLRPVLWQTFIGLLASTGLRVGEARRLTVDDVVLDGTPPHLRIVETKFRKSRIVPVHPTTADQLRQYAWHRRHLGYQGVSEVFFPSKTGAVLHRATVSHVFHRLTQQLGIGSRAGGQTPTLQSLRHTFAVERLRLWYRAGLDVQALLPQLSVYLGHLRPQDTYWYLTATPELLTLAADRFQRYADAEGGRA